MHDPLGHPMHDPLRHPMHDPLRHPMHDPLRHPMHDPLGHPAAKPATWQNATFSGQSLPDRENMLTFASKETT